MAESGQAVPVVDEGPILMKSLRICSFGMINGQVLERDIPHFKKCPLSIRVNASEGTVL